MKERMRTVKEWMLSRPEKFRLHLMRMILCLFIFGCATSNSVARADAVTDWNIIAISSATAAGKNPVEQSRLYAIVHAAIHDALNAIERRYQPYALNIQSDPAASPEAAVAAAAYGVLVGELPAQQMALDTAYANALAAIPDSSSKGSGILIGQAAAAVILALRNGDGSTVMIAYTPGAEPGDWQPTPPGFVPPVLPGWGNVTTFALRSGSQFRPGPPPLFNLAGRKYEKDYNEVKSLGDLNSATRTPEQSEIARFWYEGSQTGWNRIALVISAARGLDLWEKGRLLALLHIAMADGYIAGFDTKYTYNFWRPVTAIRAGDADGNPDTGADPAWSPFLITPPSPDYASTHSVLGAAAAEVLELFFGDDNVSFTTTSGPPFSGITRSYNSFSQAAQENAASRVYAGIHFRTSCEDGLRMGRKIGKFAFKHYLKP